MEREGRLTGERECAIEWTGLRLPCHEEIVALALVQRRREGRVAGVGRVGGGVRIEPMIGAGGLEGTECHRVEELWVQEGRHGQAAVR